MKKKTVVSYFSGAIIFEACIIKRYLLAPPTYLRVVKFFNILTTTKMYIFNELLLSVDFCLLIMPAVTYCNPEIQKEQIIKENKGKSFL